MSGFDRVAVIGAGAWGTALALVATRAGRQVTLFARRHEQAQAMMQARCNERYLPGITLPPQLIVTADPTALSAAQVLLLAMPAQELRAMLRDLAPQLPPVPLVIAAKGIELSTGLLLHQVAAALLPGQAVALLSGPTFAQEVAAGRPAAVTLAAPDAALGQALTQTLGLPTFRPYWTSDLTGVAIGGALKNVMAIAAGMVEGLQLGDNARAALITRGLAEMQRLGRALGAEAATLMGLAGLGDLVLTATASQSRNYSLGLALGRGQSLAAILAARVTVAEGVATAEAARILAHRLEVELPITQAVAAVLHEARPLKAALEALLARPFRTEMT